MFSKATLFFAFAAVASVARAASPPGCLLGAVNTYDKPADISAVCKSKDATTKIAKYCGDDTDAALEAFADICNAKGVEVCEYPQIRHPQLKAQAHAFFPVYTLVV